MRGWQTMSIEQRFNVPMIAELALREKQIQQNYLLLQRVASRSSRKGSQASIDVWQKR